MRTAILVIIKNCCSFHCQKFDEYIIWDSNCLLAYTCSEESRFSWAII